MRRVNWDGVLGWIVFPALAWAGVAVLAWLVFHCLTGCAINPHHGLISPGGVGGAAVHVPPLGVPEPDPTPAPTQPSQGFPLLGWLGGLCALIGVGTFVASFFVPILSTKLSFGCMIAAVGLWVLQYILIAYFHVIAIVALWAGVAALLLFGLPYIVAAVRRLDLGTAKKMLKAGKVTEGLALFEHVYTKDRKKAAAYLKKNNLNHVVPMLAMNDPPAPQNPPQAVIGN